MSAENPTIEESLNAIVAAARDGMKLDYVIMVGQVSTPGGEGIVTFTSSTGSDMDAVSVLTLATAIAAKKAWPNARAKDARRKLYEGIDTSFSMLTPALPKPH